MVKNDSCSMSVRCSTSDDNYELFGIISLVIYRQWLKLQKLLFTMGSVVQSTQYFFPSRGGDRSTISPKLKEVIRKKNEILLG